MKHLFVPIEIAKTIKEKGFYEPCMKGIKNGEELTTCGFSITNHSNMHDIALPLFQQVLDWLREKHGIHVESMSPVSNSKLWHYVLHKVGETPAMAEIKHVGHDDYYKALTAGIEEALTLI